MTDWADERAHGVISESELLGKLTLHGYIAQALREARAEGEADLCKLCIEAEKRGVEFGRVQGMRAERSRIIDLITLNRVAEMDAELTGESYEPKA